MKTFFLAVFSLFILVSCKKNAISNKGIIPENANEIAAPSNFEVDSLKVEDSITLGRNLKLHTSSKVLLLFPSIKNKTVLDSIYSNAGIKLDNYSKENIQKVLFKEKEAYFTQSKNDSKEYMPDFEQTWEENSYMNVFSNKNDILILTYEDEGYSGGAHGYYGISYKNFDLKNNKTIQLSDVFIDINRLNWNEILMKHFSNKDQKEMLLEEKISVNNNFYFDNKNITFVYNQYEITAYAAGVVEISIPFSEISQYLKPEFKNRMGIK